MTRQAIELPKLRMPYPTHVNSHFPALHEENETWARRMGMLGCGASSTREAIWSLPQFHAMAVDRLTAWTVPGASLADLRLAHRLMLWTLAWDDYFASAFKQPGDLPGARAFTTRLHAFLSSVPGAVVPDPTNAVEQGLADIQDHLLRSTPAHMQQELNRALRRYIDAGVQELANNLAGRVPDLIEYALFRRESFAAYTAPCFVELSTGAQIPENIRHTRTVSALLDAFMDHMGLANDIVSYQREVDDERDVNNLVVVLEASLGITVQEAVCAAADLVNARLRYFEHLAQTELPPLIRQAGLNACERAGLETWLQGALSFLSGLYAWYTSARRYVPEDEPLPGQRPTAAAVPVG
ncbi:hypothetical protein AB0F13_23540 [Streptomyces sp. NPDC026206]|uniref:terpene synthase family protein n=1 Tax=Streptomyces sp. NPDC026206 TaxID=3157089 RepID=UPI0033D867FF